MKKAAKKKGSGKQPQSAKPGIQARTPLQRMIRMHEWIDSGSYPNSRVFSKAFEYCIKTIGRDLDFMRYSLGLPIAYDRSRHGFYYTEAVKQFPTVKITRGELTALFVARQALKSHRGTPFEPSLRSAFEKITQGMDAETSFRWEELDATISFQGNGCEVPLDLQIFTTLSEAAAVCEEVEFRYLKLKAKKPEHRRVQPMRLVNRENAWYLRAYDLVRNEYRSFALSRMDALKRTGTKFERRADFDKLNSSDNSIGIYRGGKPERVRLWASGIAARLLQERSWHSSQQVVKIPGADEEVEVSMHVAITPDLERWILSWGTEARVLEPVSLREKIGQMVQEMAGNYSAARSSRVAVHP